MHSHRTDTGGGGTREGLFIELYKKERACDLNEHLNSACTLHGMNRAMQSLCEKYFGDGSVSNYNAAQSLFTCWSL